MASNADGFKDLRTKTELLLAPRRPKSRTVLNPSSLKLNIGGIALPGTITNVSQLTGPIRTAFTDTIKAKAAVGSILGSLTAVLGQFDKLRTTFERGNLIQKDGFIGVNTSITDPSEFFRFSGLNPGQAVPASFKAIIDQRKQQVQQLAGGFATKFNAPSAGLILTENLDPKVYPLSDDLDLPTISRLAQGGSTAKQDSTLKDKIRFTVKGVTIGAGKPSFWSRLLSAAAVVALPTFSPVANQIFKDRKNGKTWSEPTTPYAAVYPYNKVTQTESGHVFELDDTPGAERVHIFHRSGSFVEFHPNGTVVFKSMKDNYHISMADQFIKVSGKCHLAVDGATTVYVKGDVDIQSDGNVNINAKKDFNVYADNINLRAKKTFKGDGRSIDLRYIKLPGGIMPIMTGLVLTGFAPRVNLAAMKVDFPTVDFTDPKAIVGDAGIQLPNENPLSNPLVYAKKTPRAIAYRAKFFDTPEEVGDFEMYSGHLQLQTALKDYAGDPKVLGGKRTALTTNITEPATLPTINYLNFDEFKGKYSWADTTVLGGTSFTLRDLVDTTIAADVTTKVVV